MVEPRIETQSTPFAYYHALGCHASLNLLMLLRKLQKIQSGFTRLIKIVWLGCLLASGCIRLERISTETPSPVAVPTAQATISIQEVSTPDYGWEDVSYLMSDVCFEAITDIAGKVITIRDANALEAFYNQIDRNQACEQPVRHMSYPFNNGEMLVGLWSSGIGCGAHHVVQGVQRDDAQRQETIQLELVIEGDCPYELLQGFWIAIPQSTGFNTQIVVQPAS
jgi:hypothetical protein